MRVSGLDVNDTHSASESAVKPQPIRVCGFFVGVVRGAGKIANLNDKPVSLQCGGVQCRVAYAVLHRAVETASPDLGTQRGVLFSSAWMIYPLDAPLLIPITSPPPVFRYVQTRQ